MASLLSKARLFGLCVPLVLVACGDTSSSLPSDPVIDSPENLPLPSSRTFSLERENQGPFMERTVERFHAITSAADVKSVLWSASGGKLETQGLEATWTLPRAGTASLTLTAQTESGQQLTETFQFRVSAEASAQADGSLANVPLAPVAVDTSSDSTGYVCDLAFDSSGNGHLIYFNDTHPSIWYGFWNGTSWTTQLVDGLGYNTGGTPDGLMSVAVDSAGNPHIAYSLRDSSNTTGIWYATRSGSTWTREHVDSASIPAQGGHYVSIGLDPSQGNRPTIAYVTTNTTDYSYRVAVAFRTGANAWSASRVTFPIGANNSDQRLRGEILFDSAGRLYVPYGGNGLGAWKAPATVTGAELPISFTYEATLARTTAGHVLLRHGNMLVDFTPAASFPASTSTVSLIEANAPDSGSGDLIFAGGKPQEIHAHGPYYSTNPLELTTTDSSNYWTYTNVGTTSGGRPALAQRPTTGTIHYCFRSGSKVMFQ